MTKKSAALVVEEIILFWRKTKITAQKDHIAVKVIKLFTERANLKKNKENKKK